MTAVGVVGAPVLLTYLLTSCAVVGDRCRWEALCQDWSCSVRCDSPSPLCGLRGVWGWRQLSCPAAIGRHNRLLGRCPGGSLGLGVDSGSPAPPHPRCVAFQDAERHEAAALSAAKVSEGSGGDRGSLWPREGSTGPAAGAVRLARAAGLGLRDHSPGSWSRLRGAAGKPRTLTPSPLAPSSYSHALDGMYRVLREGEAVPAG